MTRRAPHRRATRRAAALVAAVAAAGLLPGACTPEGAVVGAAATTGVAAAQERGIGGAVEDTKIRLRINDKWFQADEVMYRKVSLQVQQGRVLLTGVVPTEEMRDRAVRLAWQAEGVEEVINEIEVGDGPSVSELARDTWISTRLKGKLLFDEKIDSINYSIETSRQTIYLIGVAQSQAELDRAIAHARSLPYVRGVVSYVQVMQPDDADAGQAET
jgi:osmotically-inducible protein OsmY